VLVLNNVEAIYSDVILAVKGISMTVPEGKCVTLLGGNGAGKSTTLKAISNLIRTEDGKVTSGSIEFGGQRIDGQGRGHRALGARAHHGGAACAAPPHRGAEPDRRRPHGVRRGPSCAAVSMTVYADRAPGGAQGPHRRLPVGRRAADAGDRSRLMSNPKLIMIDEPSLGLAPMIVDEVFTLLGSLKRAGMTLLIVEQNTRVALDIADYGYVMENGRIVLEGAAVDLKANEDVREFYLGLNLEGERKSYREVKHYRRRKRWLG
jgi:branched-chain amino acid transport system ATP-binding protein